MESTYSIQLDSWKGRKMLDIIASGESGSFHLLVNTDVMKHVKNLLRLGGEQVLQVSCGDVSRICVIDKVDQWGYLNGRIDNILYLRIDQ